MDYQRIRQLFRQSPHLVDGMFVRSRAEAERLYAEGFPSPRETVLLAKARSDLPSEAWLPAERALASAERRAAKRSACRARCAVFASLLLAHKRLAVACAILAAVLAFLFLVPGGRLLARGIHELFSFLA